MEPIDRRTMLLGLLGVAGAAVAGCSDGASTSLPTSPASSTPTTPPSTPTPTRTPVGPSWPLTGRPVADRAALAHAAVAVKVPDNKNEHPQVGIDQADIVFVELDGYRDSSGYSGTRLMPVFHSVMPEGVAPVRSIRPVDIPLLSPIGALIGNTGATGWVLNYVKAHTRYIEGMLSYMETKGTGSYSIDPKRVRKYQGNTYYDRAVVCHPSVLAKQTAKFKSGPIQPYFPFAAGPADASTATGAPAVTVRVPWKPGATYDMVYSFDAGSGRYLRSMPWGKHVLTNGTRVATDNVLVILAKQHYDKIAQGSGGDEPIHDIIDSTGTFYYAHGGKYVTGTWAKRTVEQVFTFTVADGSPLKMAPGQTFVELPQAGSNVRFEA